MNVDDNRLNINGYAMKRCDHPSDNPRGGVCVYHKESLPLKLMPELTALTETLIMEVKIGSKKCFLTAIYRSPATENNTAEEINCFISKLQYTIENISKLNPYVSIIIGDLNAKNTRWWGEVNDKSGMLLYDLFDNLNLIQVIDQPTHFRPGCNPSCIDLITTSEPNLILESGVLPTLVDTCHHQITFAKIDFNVNHAPPYKRMIWNYDLADDTNIKKCLNDIDWN